MTPQRHQRVTPVEHLPQKDPTNLQQTDQTAPSALTLLPQLEALFFHFE
jgi:hypothetical protein